MIDVLARQYLGVPFRHLGRNPAVGIDCVGLLVLALDGAPATALDPRTYGTEPTNGLLESYLAAAFGPPIHEEPAAGDVVSMRFGGPVRHVAIVGEGEHGLTLIHTSRMIGKVVEHRLDARWRRRIAGVYRL